MACQEAAPDFHARFSAVAKTYIYDLSTAPVLPPLLAGLAWHLPRQLDPHTLADALALFIGEHDFRAFAAVRGNETEDTSHTRAISTSPHCALVAILATSQVRLAGWPSP